MTKSYSRFALLVLILALSVLPVTAQRLFVGLEDASLATRSSDLVGFPTVTWTNHYPFEVNGAAATPEGVIYLCNGAFTTHLYTATLEDEPAQVATVSVDIHGMGYGGGKLYGFSNYGSPMGIYEINPTTGQATLAVSTATEGFRFFGLDFNAEDGLLYGYTEYGTGGLYSIDPVSGAMVRYVSYPPGVNGQGRALAVGNNVVYLLSTRGDEGEPCFAYDLDQGIGGSWVGFTNPYPAHHNTGGACWIAPSADVPEQGDALTPRPRLWISGPNPALEGTTLGCAMPAPGTVRIDLFDSAGRWVTTLVGGSATDRDGRVAWDGTDFTGRPVSAGSYLARLHAAGDAESVRILVVR